MLELSRSFADFRKSSSSSEKNSLHPHMWLLKLESKNHAVLSVSLSTCAIRSNSFVVTAFGASISDKQLVEPSFYSIISSTYVMRSSGSEV